MKSDTERKKFYTEKLHKRKSRMHVHLSKELRSKLKIKKRAILLRKGDTVRIMRGPGKGKEAKVSDVNTVRRKVFVEGVVVTNTRAREVAVPVEPSNLLLISLEPSKERKEIFSEEAFKKKEAKKEEKKEEKAVPPMHPEPRPNAPSPPGIAPIAHIPSTAHAPPTTPAPAMHAPPTARVPYTAPTAPTAQTARVPQTSVHAPQTPVHASQAPAHAQYSNAPAVQPAAHAPQTAPMQASAHAGSPVHAPSAQPVSPRMAEKPNAPVHGTVIRGGTPGAKPAQMGAQSNAKKR